MRVLQETEQCTYDCSGIALTETTRAAAAAAAVFGCCWCRSSRGTVRGDDVFKQFAAAAQLHDYVPGGVTFIGSHQLHRGRVTCQCLHDGNLPHNICNTSRWRVGVGDDRL